MEMLSAHHAWMSANFFKPLLFDPKQLYRRDWMASSRSGLVYGCLCSSSLSADSKLEFLRKG